MDTGLGVKSQFMSNASVIRLALFQIEWVCIKSKPSALQIFRAMTRRSPGISMGTAWSSQDICLNSITFQAYVSNQALVPR